VWCPASLSAPTPGANGCTPSSTNLANLIGVLSGAPPAQDGIIWIQAGTDGSIIQVTLNAAALGAMPQYKLTLRGGWDGNPGSKLITGSSTFGARLAIVNWLNDVTLSDIDIAFAPGTAATDALSISTSGNLTLTRVNSHHNNGTGARLNTAAGTGSVTISASQFSTNNGTDGGLYLLSAGNVTLANVVANSNGNASGTGARLDNTLGSGALTISASQFNSNLGTNGGLLLRSAGKVTLANLTASSNSGGNGANIDNFAGLAGVTLTGVNTFDDNRLNGLRINSNGAISANDLSANRNGVTAGYGAILDNDGALTPQPVTLTGTNIFTDNYVDGLYVVSAGAIKLNNVTANSNTHGSGAEVSNQVAATPQPVTLTGTNRFKYNRDNGLYIVSKGTITINNLTASGNTLSRGADLTNVVAGGVGGVTLTGANSFYDNTEEGLSITSHGAIKTSNLTAMGNGFVGSAIGVRLYNAYDGDSAGITLTGTNTISGNYAGGLLLTSRGIVAINSLTASDNPNGTGATIENTLGIAKKVSLTGTNVFNGMMRSWVETAAGMTLST